jgi:hypothetical protein
MLTTKSREPLEVIVDASSSTVLVGPAIVQFGDTVARFDGSVIPYRGMTSLYGSGLQGYYQMAVLSLAYYDSGTVSMTCYDSTVSSKLSDLIYASTDSTSAAPSAIRSVGAFTFQSVDANTVNIISYSKII